jgi:hypothetical protein
MAKFNLPIKSTYVPDWGLWECLRELIQNAKDEEDQHGHAMTVAYAKGVLTIHNEGADMDRRALLIGHSGKTGSNLRGKFGEGLDLALLAGVRVGASPVIATRSETWTPTISYSDEFGANCLTVSTRARRTPGPGVTITLNVSEGDWERYRDRFLFLAKIPDNRIVRVDGQGSILLEEGRRGHVYVRGIYVDCLSKLECGYDLSQMDLDRDRRMIDVWDLQWRLGQMYREAIARRPELLGPRVYGMLRDGAEDTKSFHYHARGEALDSVVASFREEHGEDAVPVASIAEARELEHVGRKGVVVPEPLRETLKELPELNAARVKEGLKNEVVRSVPWSDLSFEEQAIAIQYTTMLDKLAVLNAPVASVLDIAEYRDDRIEGLYDPNTGRISVAHRLLGDPRKFLRALVHEVAHAVSSRGDGAHDHVSTIETIWSKLFFSRTSS